MVEQACEARLTLKEGGWIGRRLDIIGLAVCSKLQFPIVIAVSLGALAILANRLCLVT